ncbi:MAG TPA: PIG-L deacetylase family protein [Chryseolinea sp.]|nr:PIG-L deacetylase family protein [Chryseolinea sp.]
MKDHVAPRREFIKRSVAGLGGIASISTDKFGADQGTSVSTDNKLKIVCVGAHPGDPEFGCGGTMAKYADAGHSVTFIYITRGEASDPDKTHSEMASARTREAEAACSILKAKAIFAGQIDGATVLDKNKNDQFQQLLKSENPDVIFTQWPVDAHADHQVSGLLALTAWVNAGRKFHLYFYEVNTGSETMSFTPTDYVDISAVRERKKQAMFAHKTQDPINTYNKFFEPLEVFRGLQAGVTAAEGFIYFKPNQATEIVGLQNAKSEK